MWKPTHAKITVHGARNLKAKGRSDTNDAYVLVELGQESHKTTVVERTKDPVWNEDYVFSMQSELSKCESVLRVGVYHRNLLSMDELLGQTDIPLYKMNMSDKPQIRRMTLISGKQNEAGKGRRSDDSEIVSQGSIDLTITFTVQPITESKSDLLRSSKAFRIEDPIVRPRYARRASLPAPAPLCAEATAKKSRRSVMSMLDVPSSFSALRRRLNSFGDTPLPRVVEAPATWLAHDELPPGEENSHLPPHEAELTHQDILRSKPSRCARPRSMPNILDDEEPKMAPDAPTPDAPISYAQDVLTVANNECDLVGDDVRKEEGEMKVAEREKDDSGADADDDDCRRLSKCSANRFQRMIHKPPTVDDLDKFSGYNREDLIAMVIRQHAQMTLTDTYVAELEHYTSILVLRAMEIQPRLLQSPTCPVTDQFSYNDTSRRGGVVAKPASVAKRATKEILAFVQNR